MKITGMASQTATQQIRPPGAASFKEKELNFFNFAIAVKLK